MTVILVTGEEIMVWGQPGEEFKTEKLKAKEMGVWLVR
jgi:hypothetical protein